MDEVLEKIIEFVKLHEEIYNKRSVGYHNKLKKSKLWAELAQQLNMDGK